MRFLTAGESHGPGLTAILEGLPAGFILSVSEIDTQLARRQSGYGRGERACVFFAYHEHTCGQAVNY